jgi:uncharacterized membrane protein (UPF0127 family)
MMPHSRPLNRFILLLLSLLLPAGCGSDGLMQIRVGDADARVSVADTDEERREGLMHREKLGRDEGMLLVLPQPRRMRLWMLNTHIPLDVGFFDAAGVLRQIVSMEPDGGRRIHASAEPVSYALEMNRGWFDRYGLRPGAQLQLAHPIEAR